MNMKKLIAMLMALMMVLALAACGSNDTPAANNGGNDGDNAAPTYANALEKIKGEGELHVALSPDFSPMEFVDSSKTGQEQYVGFDVSLAKFIAEELGVSLVIEPMSFDASQTAVYTASVPMSISGYSWTETRAENYEISDYYYAGDNETEQVLLIKAEDAAKYTKVEDFAGQDVGVGAGHDDVAGLHVLEGLHRVLVLVKRAAADAHHPGCLAHGSRHAHLEHPACLRHLYEYLRQGFCRYDVIFLIAHGRNLR